MFDVLKLKAMKLIYKKRYGKDWKKYFMNPFRAYSGYMPVQFDGEEFEEEEDCYYLLAA